MNNRYVYEILAGHKGVKVFRVGEDGVIEYLNIPCKDDLDAYHVALGVQATLCATGDTIRAFIYRQS
jgi:hypothetical protein